MKKFLYCISILFIALILFACKSKDAPAEDGVVVEKVSEQAEEEKNEKSDEKNNDSEDEESDENGDELAEKEMADRGFIGWIDSGKKNPSYEDGLVKIKTNTRLGTFCIYAVDLEEKEHAVISSLNEYTSSSFYLKAGKKIFKLSANDKVKTGTSELENGVRLIYDIKNIATVLVDMKAFPALKDRPADTIEITVTVKNIGKRVENFSLKAILDTILGENGKFHFYNYEGVPIKNEALYRSMKDVRWLLSKNDRASLQILLDGGDVTPVEFVSLSNFKTLENAKWLPAMQSLGAFDTVLSYNNSAVGVFWPETRVKPDESYVTTFYLSVALDGMTPNGYKYVYNIETPEPVVEPEVINVIDKPMKTAQEESEKKNDTNSEKVLEEPVKSESEQQTEFVHVEEEIEEVVEKPEIPNVSFNVDNISKDHLTQEYVNSLLDRITELENLGASANRGEILQLSAELDAILSILKR